jgi:hypothetical protein
MIIVKIRRLRDGSFVVRNYRWAWWWWCFLEQVYKLEDAQVLKVALVPLYAYVSVLDLWALGLKLDFEECIS